MRYQAGAWERGNVEGKRLRRSLRRNDFKLFLAWCFERGRVVPELLP